jgi:ATP-dependent Clp protease protease subunit
MNDEALDRIDCPEEDDSRKFRNRLELELLRETRTVLISDSVDRELMGQTVVKLLYLENVDPKAPITVVVNSPGGDADSGFAIYDMMKFVGPEVRTVCAGLCASAGVIIFLGGEKGQRYSLPNARFLLHQPSTGTQGQASDIEITAKEIMKTRDRYNRIVSDETGVDVEKITKDANRDLWLSAPDAHEYGLVDKIISSHKELK